MQRMVDWLQLAASLAVLIGLVLVVVELRQSRAIAEAEIINQSFEIGAANVSAVMGENAAAVLAKACVAPASLTEEELVVASFYNKHRLSLVRRLAVISRSTELYADGAWQAYARGNVLPEIFSSEVGRAWWRTTRPYLGNRELETIGNELLETLGPPSCGDEMRAYAEDVRAG